MRTTIDIPDDLHRQVVSIARDTERTLSETVVELMRRGMGQGAVAEQVPSERTGLPVVRIGKVTTTEDVRSLEDDEP